MTISALSVQISPRPSSLQHLSAILDPLLRTTYADSEFVFSVLTAVHEIVSNVVEHARPHSDLQISFVMTADGLSVTIIDDGQPFTGNLDGSGTDAGQGNAFMGTSPRGRGLQLTRALVDELTYSRADNENCWQLRKRAAVPIGGA